LVSNRTERVSALILEEISRTLVRLDDRRLRGVTCTHVKVSKDLRIAHVHYSLIGGEDLVKAAGEALARASGVFKRAIGENLDLRYMPELEFHLDKNIAHADRIERLLREIHEQEAAKDRKDTTDDDATGD